MMLKSRSLVLLFVLVAQAASETPAQQAASRAASAVPAPTVRPTSQPGSEATLRRLLAEMASGKLNYDLLAPAMATTLRQNLPTYQQQLRALGELKSVTFANAMPDGSDIFDVSLANGSLQCMIRLDAQGKVLAGDCREAPSLP